MNATTSPRALALLALLPSYFDIEDTSKLFYALFDAFGQALDGGDSDQDPNQWRVQTATGEALDRLADFFGVSRFAGETDTAFRARILASLASRSGTRKSVHDAVALYVPDPLFTIFEFGSDSWVLGDSALGYDTIIRTDPLGPFEFEVYVITSGEGGFYGPTQPFYSSPPLTAEDQARIRAAVKDAKMAGTVDNVFFV